MSRRQQHGPPWPQNGAVLNSSSTDLTRYNAQNFQRECKVGSSSSSSSSHGFESRFNNPARRHAMYRKNRERHVQWNRGNRNEEEKSVWHSNASFSIQDDDEEMAVDRVESDLPGYYYDEEKKKYFAISKSVRGFTESDLRAKARAQRISQARPRIASASFGLRPVMAPLSSLLRGREAGFTATPRIERQTLEIRMLNLTNTPDSVHPVHVSDSRRVQTLGCQFLDVSPDGETLVGCWGAAETMFGSAPPNLNTAHITCFSVAHDSKLSQRAFEEADEAWPSPKPGNRLGLTFRRTEHEHGGIPSGSSLVDMTRARVDSDVTCLLYATASTQYSPSGIHTQCAVRLQPLPELSSDESFDAQSSPIYNFVWRESAAVWSCAWNENLTRIGLGMEDTAKIIDVVAETSFRISSRRRNVLCQHFTQEGNGLWMGLKNSDMTFADLRMRHHHETMSLKNTNTGWMHIMASRPECLLTENFKGELKLWDTRTKRVVQIFAGHRNSHYRLQCLVDPEERLLFAVGSDGTTRGWSLQSGDMLCALTTPRPGTSEKSADFPRMAFSRRWAGRTASEAVILAVGDSLRVYELKF